MRILCTVFLVGFLLACGSGGRLAKYYNAGDKQVFELLDKLKKSPGDNAALDALPQVYALATQEREKQLTQAGTVYGPGEKWVQMRKLMEVGQQMHDAIVANPAALKLIPNPADFKMDIENMRQHAAEDYYAQGLENLAYNNRQYAQLAYDAFAKANQQISGYKDVAAQMRLAQDLATIKVVVNPVNYYNQSWGYWGFENDYLQWQMINDLNARSYRNVKFYTDAQARSQFLHPDRIVDLDMTRIFISNIFTDRNTVQRSAQVPGKATTKSVNAKPVYQTVTATVTITKRYMNGNGSLQCRIYDVATNRNILYDNFPGSFNWVYQTATYKGDQRALTAADLQLINNNQPYNPPSRNAIAKEIVRQSYTQLLSRINNGVSFDN
jgi:hypothetical protein